MNKTEEYLDSLLNNVSPERKAEADRKRRRTSADFVKEFESDLDETDIDDVIREFEEEISGPESAGKTEDGFFGNLEGIVNTAKEASAVKQTRKEDRFEVDTLEDDSWIEPSADPEEAGTNDEHVSEEERELSEALSSLPTAEDISDISGSAGSVYQEDDDFEEEYSERETPEKKPKKESKKEEKKGFFGKLSKILFGDDDDEVTDEKEQASEGEAGESGSKKDKGKKKKDKKEKKAKEKKPKEKKAKEPKPKKEKKEKKPKKPKEVDLSPPLPKAPVILIFIMCFSVMLFVIISSTLLGYSTSIEDAKAAYAAQNYVDAYETIAGLEAKSADEEFCQKVFLLAKVQGKMANGDSLYGSGKYTMALDSYICALGRYDANYEDAAACQIQKEYDNLQSQIVTRLQEKFQVSEEEARELYRLNNRTEYSVRVYQLVKAQELTE